MQYREPLSPASSLCSQRSPPPDAPHSAGCSWLYPQEIPELEGGPDETSPHPVLVSNRRRSDGGDGPCCVQQQRKRLKQQWQQVADPDRHVAVADGRLLRGRPGFPAWLPA